ncbi:uncharacterized protein LOC141712022 isoform X2 [Apium graveolens]|uniref:uncharacterized protein LOC141712022 isoform X2 n=1 Tax=Apium graveolens TaxID=4045 RepID=UPI003D7A2E0B
MGKISEQQLPLHQQQVNGDGSHFNGFGICFSMGGVCKVVSFKCFVVVILSVSVFLGAIRWGLPHHAKKSGFDAKEYIKNGATVQAYFRLQKPVSVLIPVISKLEYDINEEIGVPSMKVAILSMHPAHVINSTDVIFGLLSDRMDAPVNTVYLSVLRSSLIGVFLQQINLTLTNSTFGQPALFEILKFPGGITVIPESVSLWQIPQIFFNFTLHNSIYDIKQNVGELKEQLRLGLHLAPDENMYVQLTNKIGSTANTPVTVQISVTSDLGGIVPQRLKQIAQTITGSPSKNLGLDNSVFGKVKQISLSSYLRNTLHASSPTPSPAPSPGGNEYVEPLYPSYISPSYSPAPLPHLHHRSPCHHDCDAPSPSDGNNPITPSPSVSPYYSPTPISNSPEPSIVYTSPPHPSPQCGSEISPSPAPSWSKPLSPSYSSPSPTLSPHSLTPATPKAPSSQTTPGLSPLPSVAYSSSPDEERRNGKSSNSPSSSSPPLKTGTFLIVMLLALHRLCWE